MRWRGVIARGKDVSPLQHVRLIRTRRLLKTPERLPAGAGLTRSSRMARGGAIESTSEPSEGFDTGDGPLFTSRLAQIDAAEAISEARQAADPELTDYIPRLVNQKKVQGSSGGEAQLAEFKRRHEGLHNIQTAQHRSQAASHDSPERQSKTVVNHESGLASSAQQGMVPHDLLEYWSDKSSEPTISNRTYAKNFFTRHKNDMLFTAGGLHQVKFTDVPEVAFLGRSNVGKSSLLNALLGAQVARTSQRPGKTQTLNAWTAGGMDRTGRKHRLTVLDMPGYGHGSRGEWGKTTTKYLHQRKELKCAFVLISASHGLKKHDVALLAELRSAAIPHQIILSKVDDLIWPAKKHRMPQRRVENTGPQYLQRWRWTLDTLVDDIRKNASDQSLPGLPAMKDIICCSGMSPFPGQSPEPQGSLGISGLRWAVLNIAGLRPQRRVTDEKELFFS